MSGSLNGLPLTRAALTVPGWGIPWADVVVASGEEQDTSPRAALLEVGGLTHVGTLVAGGVYREEGRYRFVAGAGGWRRPVAARPYRSGGGVRLASILGDVATEVGETMGPIPSTERPGGAYAREAGPASLVLDALVSEAWYVDVDGVTQLGARAGAAFAADYTVMGTRVDRDFVTVAAEDVSTLLPGATLEGLTVASVRHELTESTLRSHVYGGANGDRFLAAFRGLVDWLMGRVTWLGSYEYQVRAVTGGYVDIVPVRASKGLPKLSNVAMRTGVPGGGGEPAVGSSCVVRFLDGDPTRPYVADFEGQYGSAWLPATAKLTAAGATYVGGTEPANPLALERNLRSGDSVTFTGAPGPMVPGTPYVVAFSGTGTMSRARSS